MNFIVINIHKLLIVDFNLVLVFVGFYAIIMHLMLFLYLVFTKM